MKRRVLFFIIVTIVCIITYSHSFHAPFVFDDYRSIVENHIIKKIDNFFSADTAISILQSNRYIGYLSFAMNYKIHGLDVTGYHIFNIAIHILNAFLVYSLVLLTFKTPFLRNANNANDGRSISPSLLAFVTGLLFAVHPLQTQSVTYIVQRYVSLATFFYLVSLIAYINARLVSRRTSIIVFYTFSFLSAVLAMNTKQIAFTLPIVIILYELMFFEGERKWRILSILPLLLTMLIIPVSLIGIDKPLGEVIGDVSEVTRAHTDMSRGDYFFTQCRVLITYMRLFFFPINQNLDYDFPIITSFFNKTVLPSFLFLLSLFSGAIWLLIKSKTTNSYLRMISFGILWFFVTLSVESTVIPIRDVIFEHRMYLPAIGIIISIAVSLVLFSHSITTESFKANKIIIALFGITVILFSSATYERNSIWRDVVILWKDVLRKSPEKARGYNNLGLVLNSKGMSKEALTYLNKSVGLDPEYAPAYLNLGVSYVQEGEVDKAIKYFNVARELRPDHAVAYNNLGLAYWTKGFTAKAVDNFETAIQLNPASAEAHANLGLAYGRMGLIDSAMESLGKALDINPDYPQAHNNMGIAYWTEGFTDKAKESFRHAIQLNPAYVEAHINLGDAYYLSGNTDRAIDQYLKALEIHPRSIKAHRSLVVTYRDKGLMHKSKEHLDEAERLSREIK
jgi:tetratricopeptide (TPR) repeat protein